MTPTRNYTLFKRLFDKYGNKLHMVEHGSYSIYQSENQIFEASFLNNAGNGDYYSDPIMVIEADEPNKKVYVKSYYNNFGNAPIQMNRNPATKRELDERLYHFLNQFETQVHE